MVPVPTLCAKEVKLPLLIQKPNNFLVFAFGPAPGFLNPSGTNAISHLFRH